MAWMYVSFFFCFLNLYMWDRHCEKETSLQGHFSRVRKRKWGIVRVIMDGPSIRARNSPDEIQKVEFGQLYFRGIGIE